jgi:hypothetical protein
MCGPIIVLAAAHVRRILKSYARYYNETRTHLALDKDAPVSRPVQRIGVVRSLAILGGLHHHCARAKVFGTHNTIKYDRPLVKSHMCSKCCRTRRSQIRIMLTRLGFIRPSI